MPRKVRGYGRPGTRVIPPGWGASHAQVTDDTLCDTVVVYRPGPDVWDEVAEAYKASEVPVYDGPATVTSQTGPGGSHVTQGEDPVLVGAYQVRLGHAVDLDLDPSPTGQVDELRVRVTASADPDLVGRVLVVADETRAARRFSRHLSATLAT